MRAWVNETKPVSLAEMPGVSKGLVSDILNYKKGLSKEIIRKLSDNFKLSQEAFNRHYDLAASVNGKRTHSGKVSSGRRIAVYPCRDSRLNITYLKEN